MYLYKFFGESSNENDVTVSMFYLVSNRKDVTVTFFGNYVHLCVKVIDIVEENLPMYVFLYIFFNKRQPQPIEY
jgi:hypothetical protein